ncbi:MAG TPA: hypothetical protein DCG45_01820, partial [Alcanivorax sp.]|nr:hypothetical protein [Alcanivorax sp.]
DVGQTLQAMFATLQASTYVDRGREYDVLLEANESEARVPDDVNPIYVRTDAGELVPLSSVVDLKTVGASP